MAIPATADVSATTQYGPLAAALIALVGAMITLIVTGRREERRRRDQALDEYLREQRTAVAAIVTAVHGVRRAAADVNRCLGSPSRGLLAARESSLDSAATDLLNALTVSRILVHDTALQEALDHLMKAWSVTGDQVERMLALLAVGADVDSTVLSQIAASWPPFDQAAEQLQEVALQCLAPSVLRTSRP